MRTIAITIVAFLACANAFPSIPNIYADVYRNTLTPQARIVGGEDAARNQFPYQLSLTWGILGVNSHICGASLIQVGWGLTAGHCSVYSFGDYDVVLGQLQQGESNENIQTIKVVDFIVHPGYPGGAAVASNDIAILRLESDAVLNDAVQLIELGSEEECSAIDEQVTLSGWGLTNSIIPIPPTNLKFINLPRISNQECADDLTAILGSQGPLDDSMICTGQEEGKKQSACSGDSGGPLARSGKLVGVVSWGITPCGTKGAPSVFTKVSSHRQWIDDTISPSSA